MTDGSIGDSGVPWWRTRGRLIAAALALAAGTAVVVLAVQAARPTILPTAP